jgi:hypothetical protein
MECTLWKWWNRILEFKRSNKLRNELKTISERFIGVWSNMVPFEGCLGGQTDICLPLFHALSLLFPSIAIASSTLEYGLSLKHKNFVATLKWTMPNNCSPIHTHSHSHSLFPFQNSTATLHYHILILISIEFSIYFRCLLPP